MINALTAVAVPRAAIARFIELGAVIVIAMFHDHPAAAMVAYTYLCLSITAGFFLAISDQLARHNESRGWERAMHRRIQDLDPAVLLTQQGLHLDVDQAALFAAGVAAAKRDAQRVVGIETARSRQRSGR